MSKEKIDQLVKEIYEKVKEAEALADEHGIEFGLNIAYGMGGQYYPKSKDGEARNEWAPSTSGWYASSQSC